MAISLSMEFFASRADRVEDADDGLSAELEQLWMEAQARWPGVSATRAEFARWLGARVGSGPGADTSPLSSLHTGDLYLVCACEKGDAAAFARLSRHCFVDAEGALRSLGLGAAEIDDVRQRVLTELVAAGPGRRSGFARYRGRGPLRRWLRTIAVRCATRDARLRPRHVDTENGQLMDAIADASPDPELVALASRHRPALAAAFVAALGALSIRERNLLRQFFLDGLSVDALGTMYGIHRSTAARWVVRARRRLAAATLADLAATTGAEGRELESLMGLVQSQLDVSVARLLGGAQAECGPTNL